ncbi:MTMRB protein, partial [Tachuris rubrigastra]|nr:MTMRB protein [Tachuris rubrigastra]
ASSFSKPKVLTATSTLKFIPEELAVFCRDFRLLRFSFPENGLAPQAFRVANAIAQAREAAAWPGGTGEGHDGWSCPAEAPPEEEEEEDDEEEDEEEGLGATLLFESLRDWEKELERLGAVGWRVSAVNERFDMAPSLPRYLWVPSGLLDHDLKRTFGHFQERRVPVSARGGHGREGGVGGDGGGVTLFLPQRLCWHHPAGGDLLRAAGFHPASEPGSEDISRGGGIAAGGETLLCRPARWGHREGGVGGGKGNPPHHPHPSEPSDRDLNCLLASLVQLLGDPHARSLPGFQSLVQREWVAAGHPFPHRLGLLRRDTPREEAPVFLLFLDCTWQLLRQFPADFGFTEAFLLALHDSSFSPYFSTFRFSCQRQRGHGGPPRPRSQTYRPVGGWQDPSRGPGGLRGGPSACPFPPVWAWGLRYSREQRERFRNPAGPPVPTEPPGRVSEAGQAPRPCWGAGPVLALAKGSLCPHPLPWRSGRSPSRPPQRDPPPESRGGVSGVCPCPPGLLLPCTAAPCVRLWHRCFLRALPQEQRGRFAPSWSGLAEELELLQDRIRAW